MGAHHLTNRPAPISGRAFGWEGSRPFFEGLLPATADFFEDGLPGWLATGRVGYRSAAMGM